jgi:hypothetical protein
MATTTLKAIIDRFQAVCEASPLSLKPSQVPFSHDREPNATLESAYYLEDGGLSESRSGTNDLEFRMDTLTVWLTRKLAFSGQTQAETLQTTMTSVERRILADGPANSYHARVTARAGPAQAGESDRLVAGVTFTVDYDFTTAS